MLELYKFITQFNTFLSSSIWHRQTTLCNNFITEDRNRQIWIFNALSTVREYHSTASRNINSLVRRRDSHLMAVVSFQGHHLTVFNLNAVILVCLIIWRPSRESMQLSSDRAFEYFWRDYQLSFATYHDWGRNQNSTWKVHLNVAELFVGLVVWFNVSWILL